jgi:signal transduction histidine kinase
VASITGNDRSSAVAQTPPPFHPLPRELLCQHGFAESGAERGLLDLLEAAAAFCAAPAALTLADRAGVWFFAGAGLDDSQLADLEPTLGCPPAEARLRLHSLGWYALADLALTDPVGEELGRLRLLAPAARPLPEAQWAGLRVLAERLGRLVATRAEQAEQRRVPRGPSGASFVPGLVHELQNFSFGLSASLDAFQARFSDRPEALSYGRVMRDSLDRLGAFLEELHDYGDPHLEGWRELPLEPLLSEAIALQEPLAARAQVDLRVHVDGPLPRVRMDEASLRIAFGRLLGLALEQESPGGCVVLRIGTRVRGERRVAFGHVDGSGFRLQGIDLSRLFEPFYFRPAGLGRLGLPVARRIFEVHGGNLSASPGPEGGLRMGFMLPAL